MTRAEGSSGMATVAAVAVVVAALYFAKDFLLPLALAALVAFMLNPLVEWLGRARIPRAVGVIAVILVLVSAIGLIAWLLASEVTSLVANLPDFRANLVEKLRALRGLLRSLADALGWIDRLGKEIDPAAGHAQAAKVEIVETPSAMSALGRFAPTLLRVLGTAGVVGVLALFILVQSDLPKRVSALFALRGSRISPRALREAGQLVSGFLVRQAIVCVVQGVIVTTGSALIRLPGALLFGAISTLLRSIPYFGPTTAARCRSRSRWPRSPASRWRFGPPASSSASSSSRTTCSTRASWERARACRRSVSSWLPRSGPGCGALRGSSSRFLSRPAS
jgi:predicted PurR-regulated permease PerM